MAARPTLDGKKRAGRKIFNSVVNVFFAVTLAVSMMPLPGYAATGDEGASDAPAVELGLRAGDPNAAIEGATYVNNGDVEAVEVHGEAAETPEDAKEAILGLSVMAPQKADQAAQELFEEPVVRGADEEEYPRSADGSNIEAISAKWITEDTVDNGVDSLLYIKPSDDTAQSVRLQINYALSGEHSYAPGDITITIPAQIIHKRGGAGYGGMVIPFPEDPSTRADFNWKQIGDTYVLTNTKTMSAATKGYIQFEIDGLTPHDLVDMEESAPFEAYIQVVTHLGNTIALRSNELTAQFDTEARVTDAGKRVYGSPQIVPASSIPESQRIDGEDEYVKVEWYVWYVTKANTVYTLDETDIIPQASVVNADEGLAEADVEGFIIGATDTSGIRLDKQVTNSSYANGQSNYYYISTAYPASQFKKDTEYTFHNQIEYTLEEVDPAVGDDPKLKTTELESATTVWSFTDPEWKNPDGHFMVVKNGNDNVSQNDKPKYNYTHHKVYGSSEYADTHLWSRPYKSGWYGIYPSALNDLQDEFDNHGTDGDIRLSYTVDTVGYVMPWMFDSDSYDQYGELASRMIRNYNRSITLITEDKGPSIGRNGEKLEFGTDYTYESVEFPGEPYVYSGTPQNINPDGSWVALNAGDGTFKYTRDNNRVNWPDIQLEALVDGEWVKIGTASWKTGAFVFTKKDNTTQSEREVALPERTENFRTTVTLSNTAGELANEALQAALDYDVRVNIRLKSTQEIIDLIEEAFEESNTPAMLVWNEATMTAVRADVPTDAEDREIITIDNDGYDSLRGYTTDVSVYPYKTARQSTRDVDYENRTVTIHYTAKVEERSVINDLATYEQAIDDGRLVAETHGIWRDLLPKGVTPDLSSIDLMPATDAWGSTAYARRKGDRVVDAYTIDNYKGTGRTMLVVEVALTPTPQRYRSVDMYYYEDVPRIAFDASLDFDALIDYGYEVHNVIAFESGNDTMGTIPSYTGEPDDPTAGNNVASVLAFEDESEVAAMTGLHPEREPGVESFVYAGINTKIDIISAARTSLNKEVMVNNDGWWSNGLYYDDPDQNKRIVYEGGIYAYRLRMMSDAETISKDLVLYDSLETFQAGEGNDVIDVNAPHWQGTFKGVDTSQLESAGCAPVVYYSFKDDLALSDETDPKKANVANCDLTNTEIWTPAASYSGDLSAVKAIAVDASKASTDVNGDGVIDDDDEFSLQPLESAVVIVRMLAPSGDEARAALTDEAKGIWGDSAQAYNNAYLLCTSIDKQTGAPDGENFVRKDYTKVGLMEYSYEATKVWSDDNNRDGIRPDSITMHLFADGVDTGKTVTLPIVDPDTNEESWTAVFENLIYTDEDGNVIHYSVKEDVPDGYGANVEMASESEVIITNIHEPERTSLSGEKTWINDEGNEDARPNSVKIKLYGNGSLITTKTVTPDAEGKWKYSFDDLLKYEDGQEIVYSVAEEVEKGSPGASYVPAVEGLNIVNSYNPYGDLLVNKKIENTTETSATTQFPFTFAFTRMVDGEEQPVSDDFYYDILDSEGVVINSGTLTRDNRTVTIEGGQSIHVKRIPEYVNYAVSEQEQPGFELSATGETGTIKPNETQVANFVNTYSAAGQVSLKAKKKLADRELKRYQFRFELYQVNDDGTEKLISTAANAQPDDPKLREDGTVEYSTADVLFRVLRYTQDDARAQQESGGQPYIYRIKEVPPSDATVNDDGTYTKNGYTYDTQVYTAAVTIEDKGDGTLAVTTEYQDASEAAIDSVVFENTYEAEGDLVLRVWKDLQGRKLTDGEFEFELLDEKGNPVYKVDPDTGELTGEPITAKNTADGSVVFDAIHYTQTDIGKTYYYAVREVRGLDRTIVYDSSYYGYAVEVVDNGDGTLSFNQDLATPILTANTCEVCRGDKYDPTKETKYSTLYPGGSISVRGYTNWSTNEVWPDPTATGDSAQGQIAQYLMLNGEQSHSEVPASGIPSAYVKRFEITGEDLMLAGLWSSLSSDAGVPCDIPVSGVATYYLEALSVRVGTYGDTTIYYDMGYIPGCSACAGAGAITEMTGWDTEGGELPVFENKLRDGSLSIVKYTENDANANPAQEFRFKVKLIGPNLKDGLMEYELSQTSGSGFFGMSSTQGAKKTEEASADDHVAVSAGNAKSVDAGGMRAQASEPDLSNVFHATEDMLEGTAYAVQTSDGELVFFRSNESYRNRVYGTATDIKGNTYEGMIYAGFENQNYNTSSTNDIPWFYANADYMRWNIKSVRVADGQAIKPYSMCYWFYDAVNMESFDARGFDTSRTVSMYYMFGKDEALVSLDLSTFDTSKVTQMGAMFANCRSLSNLNISSFDTSSLYDPTTLWEQKYAMVSMFTGCSSLESIDISHFKTSNVRSFSSLFSGCTNLKSINVSGLDTHDIMSLLYLFQNCESLEEADLSSWVIERENVSYESLFGNCHSLRFADVSNIRLDGTNNGWLANCTSLCKINLGEIVRFDNRWGNQGILPTPDDSLTTGKWIREDGTFGPYTPEELMDAWIPAMAGTWVWEQNTSQYMLKFVSEGASGSMAGVHLEVAEDNAIPENRFYRFGFKFDHWVDAEGNEYADKEIIPKDTFEVGDVITLTAVFVPVETTVDMEDGEFEIVLHGNERATFEKLPAGTAYQVWEETPDGWVLIEQSNVSGSIEPLQTAQASFTNKYQPGTTTAQFSGTKTLDGTAAEAGAYSFTLAEVGGASNTITVLGEDGEPTEATLPMTVSTLEGGFVQFPIIVYGEEDVGTHTYAITEVNPNDSTIDYDTHTETVTVEVTDDGKGKLSSTTTYDSDGIAFANKSRPGNLSINKYAEGTSDANKDDVFTFKVTLNNPNGQPLGSSDTVYWYTIDPWSGEIKPNASKPKPQYAEEPEEPEEPNAEPSEEPTQEPNAIAGGKGVEQQSADTYPAAPAIRQLSDDMIATFSDDSASDVIAASNMVKGTRAVSDIEPAEGATVEYSGTSGTVTWEIYTDGTMVLRPTSGSTGKLADIGRRSNDSNNWGRPLEYPPWHTYARSIKQVVARDGVALNTRASLLFADCINLERVDLSKLNTSNAQNVDGMFYKCSKLKELDLSSWDTSRFWYVTTVYWKTVGNERDYYYYGMFGGCSALETVDLTGWNLSNVAYLAYAFRGCASLTEIKGISAINASAATEMQEMFKGCSSLTKLNLGGFTSSSVTQIREMFSGCSSLFSLDVSGLGMKSVRYTNDMFLGCSKLREVKLGSDFRFIGSQGSCTLPTPPAIADGKWIKSDRSTDALTPTQLRSQWANNSAAWAGTWVWAIDSETGVVHFDGNGGYVAAQDIVADAEDYEVSIPAVDLSARPHYELVEWNTDQEGNGTSYEPGSTATDVVKLGQYVTLYAQWAPTNLRKYTVNYYTQKPNLNGYNLLASKAYYADYGTEVEAEAMPEDLASSLAAFRVPEVQNVTVLEDDSAVVDYYYDRMVYSIKYDGNGADSGQMNDLQQCVFGVTSWLLRNTYQKKGYLFNGWNTEPDGSGTSYTDRQSVIDIAEGDGATITLYAQWLGNEDGKLEPTNGVVYVYCKAGDTVVIPDLPAGTTYTVEEVDNPGGWQLSYSDVTEGTIEANVTAYPYFSNSYSAEGEIQLTAHKRLEGDVLQKGQFTFELYQLVRTNSYPYQEIRLVATATNDVLDTAATVLNDEGEEVANPWQGTASVVFDPIPVSEPGQYQFYIKEVPVEGSTAYVFDEHTEYVTVNVVDGGHGMLKAEAIYDDDGALFVNDMQTSSLSIAKELVGAKDSQRNTEFEFVVSLTDADGNSLTESYPARKETVDYAYQPEISQIAYSHMDNVDDEGNQIGNYRNNVEFNDVVTIEGAQRLEVTIVYGCEYTYSDWVCIWQGAHPEYTAGSNHYSSVTGKLGGGNHTNPDNTKTYSIDGDTATFGFHSNGSGYADGYGYYAIVKGIQTEESESGVEDLTVGSGDTVRLKGGESIVVSGLPHGTHYSIVEKPKNNWELIETTGDTGVTVVNETVEAVFANKPVPRNPYTPEYTGESIEVTLEANKTFEHGTIQPDAFLFELIDGADGSLVQRKSTDQSGVSQSTVTFDPLTFYEDDLNYDDDAIDAYVDEALSNKQQAYAEAKEASTGEFPEFADWLFEEMGMDVDSFLASAQAEALAMIPKQKTYTYLVSEVQGDADGVTYDSNSYMYKVLITKDGEAGLASEVTMWKLGETEDEDEQINEIRFVNGYDATGTLALSGTKSITGREFEPGDEWTFAIAPQDGAPAPVDAEGNEIESVTLSVAEGDDAVGAEEAALDFGTVKFELADLGGESMKDFTYKIIESGVVAGVINDAVPERTVTVRVVDKQDGTLGVSLVASESDSLTWTNTYTPDEIETIEVSITKAWNDEGDRDGIRPTAEEFAAKVHLMNGETEVTGYEPSISDNDDGTYTVTFSDLPKKDSAGGEEIAYTVKEDAIEGYEADEAEVRAGGIITNSHMFETTEISITKSWDDADDQDGIRPADDEFAAKLHLYADGTEVTGSQPQIVEYDDNTFNIIFTNLPKNAGGQPITYTVKEDGITGYKADATEVSDGGTITNTHVPGTIEVSITKAWDDADNQDGIRPTAEDFAYKVHLYADGTEVGDATPTVTDNGDGTYTVAFSNLPEKADDAAIAYTVKEDEIEGYTADKTEAEAGGTITNTHTPPELAPSGLRLLYRSARAAGYTPDAARVSAYPEVYKAVRTENGSAATLAPGEFAFELHEGADPVAGRLVATAANDASGTVAFFDKGGLGDWGLVYDKPGTWTYSIVEVPGNEMGVTYDDSVIVLTVTVAHEDPADPSSPLRAELAYADGDGRVLEKPVFENVREGMDLVVYKVSRFGGEGLVDCTYALWMVGPAGSGDVMVKEATSDETGRIVFTDVALLPGQKYYFKEVEAPSGHTVDPYRTAYFSLNEAGDGTVIVEDVADDGWHSKYDNIDLDRQRSQGEGGGDE